MSYDWNLNESCSVDEFLLPPPDDIVDQDPEASNMSDSINVSIVHQNLPCKVCIGKTASLLYEYWLLTLISVTKHT